MTNFPVGRRRGPRSGHGNTTFPRFHVRFTSPRYPEWDSGLCHGVVRQASDPSRTDDTDGPSERRRREFRIGEMGKQVSIDQNCPFSWSNRWLSPEGAKEGTARSGQRGQSCRPFAALAEHIIACVPYSPPQTAAGAALSPRRRLVRCCHRHRHRHCCRRRCRRRRHRRLGRSRLAPPPLLRRGR